MGQKAGGGEGGREADTHLRPGLFSLPTPASLWGPGEEFVYKCPDEVSESLRLM